MAAEASCEAGLRKAVKRSGTIIAGLIDPDDFTPLRAAAVASKIQAIGVSAIFVGGSTVADQSELDDVVMQIKKNMSGSCHKRMRDRDRSRQSLSCW